MIRLLLPASGVIVFVLVSLATVRIARPKQPRRFFLLYLIVLLAATIYAYVELWPLRTYDDAAGLLACVLWQGLLCFTVWNSFYSILWGFSGGLMYDLYNEPSLLDVDRLVESYEGQSGLNRILARRLPNLAAGGYVDLNRGTLRLRPKGRAIAWGTLAAFKMFSLGMGGGIR